MPKHSDASSHYLGHQVTHAKLTGERSLSYFDDVSSRHSDRAEDPRPREERAHTNDMRRDPLTGEWISVAPARNQRAHLPSEESCPLCPQTASNPSEIPGPFDVAVFDNRSPSFGPEAQSQLLPLSGELGLTQPAEGRCEVVVFSSDHRGSFSGLGDERIDTVLTAWTHRTEALKSLPAVSTVFPFENRGEDIGVTLHHPHGQIYAYPFIPPRTSQLLASSKNHGEGFFGDYLDFEAQSERLVVRGENFSAFVPFGARWPIEFILMPHRPLADFTALGDAERAELRHLLPTMLGAVDRLYDSPTGYIAAWYQAPQGFSGDEFRFHFRLNSPRRSENKLKFLAGSETAMGAFILDVAPEEQARRLREVV
jgi:UDPglucose--hexose-1-phosphate uridylyltransferase